LQFQRRKSVLFAASSNFIAEPSPVDQRKQTSGAGKPVWVFPHCFADQIVLGAIVLDDWKRNRQRPVDAVAVHVPQ
jgi:hypothetical protein